MLDFTSVEEQKDFSGIQTGEHELTIESAEVKDTKSGSGKYINCRYQDETGASAFIMYNVENDNKQAVQISMGQIKVILAACGTGMSFEDIYQLAETMQGLRFRAKVTAKEDNGYTRYALSSVSFLEKAPVMAPLTTEEIPF